jgi:hypothetical protein
VEFCNEIEMFVSCCEAMRDWRNQGRHEKSLNTYCFLVQCRTPERMLGLTLVSSWQVNIYNMPRSIPSTSTEGLNAYFDTIDCKLTYYESLRELFMLLVLGIPNDDIVLHVLSFL